MLSYFSLLALIITGAVGFASQFQSGRSYLERQGKLIFVLAVAAIAGLGFYFTFNQYQAWLGDPLTKFLLPPYQDINYFVLYSFIHFFAPYLISLIAGLLLFFIMRVLNKKFEERFFEKEEPYLAALSLFLVGHPDWLVYIATLILVYLLIHASRFVIARQSERLPLYRLWAPIAFFVILLNEYWLNAAYWWPLLKI